MTCAAGTHAIKGEVDPANALNEMSAFRGNNTRTVSVTPTNWPAWGTAAYAGAKQGINLWQQQAKLVGDLSAMEEAALRSGGGNLSGQLSFDRTYTRQASDEVGLTPSNLGLSLAAFMLGLPTSASATEASPASFSNDWVGAFAQDSWRVSPTLTLNGGLRWDLQMPFTAVNSPYFLVSCMSLIIASRSRRS